MNRSILKPRRTPLDKAFSAIFSFALIANLLSPALAFADNQNFTVSQTIDFSTPGSSSWVVPSGVSTVDVKVWAAGGAGGSGEKTHNSNLSGLGGGGGGYTEETFNVNPGDTYSIVVGAGGQGSGQNGGASSFTGTGANLLTTGGFAGPSDVGIGPDYPSSGGDGGIGNGGNSATNLGGGNGGTEGCDPENCDGNARASGGGGAAAAGAGGAGLTPGDTAGITGEGLAGFSGGGAGGDAGWCGRGANGLCTGGDPASAHATDGVFPGGGGGGSDVDQGGFGADGEVVIEIGTLNTTTSQSQAPASSSNATITLGQSFTPTFIGGSGTGSWQFVIADYTNWDPGNGESGTDIGSHPATDPNADYVLSWTPTAAGTYQFYVARNGDSTYPVSNFAGPYTLTVTPATGGGGGGTTPPVVTSSSISLALSVTPSALSAGNSSAISTSATSSTVALTQHGLELSSDDANWTNIGASNPPAGTVDNLLISFPFATAGTFYVRAYASNDNGQTYLYTNPQTVTVTPSSGGGGNPPVSTSTPSVTIAVSPSSIGAGGSVSVSTTATGGALTQHGIELSPDNVNWTNVGASNPPTNGTDTLSIMLPFPNAGTFYVRAYASNDSGQTYVYTNPQTVTVNATGGSTPPASSTVAVDISVATTSAAIGAAVPVTTNATSTSGVLTEHGVETCLVGGNCPANASSGNWTNIGASNPPAGATDTLSLNPTFNGVGTYDIRAYASNNGGQTYSYSNVDTLTVATAGSGGNPPNPTHVLEVLPQGAGTVTSAPAGISCSSISGCSAIFNTGESVVLTATPNAGDFFTTWGDACASQGTSSTCSLVMNSDMIVSATFSATSSPDVTIFVNPSTFTAGTSTSVSSIATGLGLTQHGIELSPDNVNWTNVGASNPPTNGTDTLSIMLPFPNAGTFYVRAYASNDSGQTYVYTNPQTVTVNAAVSTPPSGGGSGSGGGGGGGSSSLSGGSPSNGSGGGSHFYSNSAVPQTITTTVTTSSANTQANAPAVPVVGPSVCKAGDYITAFMKQGINNDPAEVTKLQNFLNEYEGANLDVNGTFDASTTAAVKAFQVKYAKDVLSPWGIDEPTGVVYITTAHEINDIFCSLNPGYTGGSSATTTPEFNGAVGFNVATSGTAATLGFGQNIAGVLGAMSQNIKDFLKDILWYPLLILLLLGTGTWLILRYIFLKDKKDIKKQRMFLGGIGLFSAASALNMGNTLFYLLMPAAFMARTNLTVGMVLGLDLINIVLMLVSTVAALYMFQSSITKSAVSLA